MTIHGEIGLIDIRRILMSIDKISWLGIIKPQWRKWVCHCGHIVEEEDKSFDPCTGKMIPTCFECGCRLKPDASVEVNSFCETYRNELDAILATCGTTRAI
jgi:hypothetical protein